MAEGDRRTFASYKTQVLHALGNVAAADMDITAGDIVNDALEHIAALNQWNWLSTGHVTLSITGGQDYVELPDDFGAKTALQHENSWTAYMEEVTWGLLLNMRTDGLAVPTGGYVYTINVGNVEAGAEEVGLTLPTLNLHPTPANDAANAIQMVYRRYLRRLVSGTDRPQWPAYMDRPLSLLARAFAKTDYDDDAESAYTQEFRSLIVDCISKDGLAIGSFGIQQGGVHDRGPLGSRTWMTDTIPNPTMA